MPIELVRDDAARRVFATGRGEFRPDDVIGVLASLRDSGAWTYAVLLDLRYMTGEPTIADLRPIMSLTDPSGGSEQSRGPLAIVATNPVLYGVACAYAAKATPPGRAAVFRDRDEAVTWLASRLP
jgi:hypothetical protein